MKYCRKCGCPLVQGTIQAHNVDGIMQDSLGMSFGTLDSQFNEDTGEQNVAELYYCPSHKYSRFFGVHNDHDQFVTYQGHSHYWVKIK